MATPPVDRPSATPTDAATVKPIVTSSTLRSVTGWTQTRNREFDYGAIILPTPLGSTTGWFGFGNYSDADLLATVEAAWRAPSLYDESLRLLARPGDGWALQVDVLKRKGPPLAHTLQLPALPAELSAVLPGASPCGRSAPRIKGWLGRADQTAKVRGMFVHPSQVADVLKRLPGVNMSGGNPRLRGLGSGYTLILINGDPAPPGFQFDQLNPSQIERIEITRGPSADQSAQAIASTKGMKPIRPICMSSTTQKFSMVS